MVGDPEVIHLTRAALNVCPSFFKSWTRHSMLLSVRPVHLCCCAAAGGRKCTCSRSYCQEGGREGDGRGR